jgi:hypothetical protein
LKKLVNTRWKAVGWFLYTADGFETPSLFFVGRSNKIMLPKNVPVYLAEFKTFIPEPLKDIIKPGELR